MSWRTKTPDPSLVAMIEADAAMSNAEFREAMGFLGLSLDGMAARLDIARRLVAGYRMDQPIPKKVALATRYLQERRRSLGFQRVDRS